ncbi:LOW QUALITY PROTEIN: hypothetical protein CFC21_013576, partial [Triticum aestivum]
MANMQESLALVGTMRGHNDVVTAIAAPIDNSPYRLPRQVAAGLGPHQPGPVPRRRHRRHRLRRALPPPHRPRPLRPGRGHQLRRPVRALGLLGRRAPSLGPLHRPHHPPLRRPRQGRHLGRLLRRQPPDRLRLPRQHHQALEHPRRVQVHHRRRHGRRRGPHRLGLVRQVLPQHPAAHHRLRLLGQDRQGLEPHQLQAPLHPRRPRWLCQCRRRQPRWLALRLRRQGRRHAALGSVRGEEAVPAGSRLHHPCALLLAQPLLALRCDRGVCQDLGPRVQACRAGPQARSPGLQEPDAVLHKLELERGRKHPLHRIHRRNHQGLQDPSRVRRVRV